jgi:hypothetical protein
VSASRNARIAASLVGLRSPLARIELTAGQLARSAETPGARSLARAISVAVGEVDRGLDVALGALGGAPPPPPADCRSALEAAWPRLATVLRARGVAARLAVPETVVSGDAEAVRRAAVALVGDAVARADARLSLCLCDEGGRYGVKLEGAPELGQDAAFPRARALALALQAELEVEAATGSAVLWLSREPQA